ncbi:MAG: hypothetical protein LBN95_05800 [Prevotellaceae bacterium]|jgi:hypothetical protein|nr:hypothetical protein [Prevotellaceae bacterium]
MKILEKILYNKFLRTEKRSVKNLEKNFLSYAQINSVLLIFKTLNDSEIAVFENIANVLKKDGKKVVMCCFSENKKSMLESSDNLIIIKKNNLNFWQKPENELLDKISEQNFDAVIDLSLKKSIPLLYILLHSQAKIKCGRQIQSDLLDFMIDISSNPLANEKELFDNIVNYLKIINK